MNFGVLFVTVVFGHCTVYACLQHRCTEPAFHKRGRERSGIFV